MGLIKRVLAWVVGLLSAYMAFNRLGIFISTSGTVQGSEFGMLITLANQLGLIMVWLAVVAIHRLLPEAGASVSSAATHACDHSGWHTGRGLSQLAG